jgi:hypothetical protein
MCVTYRIILADWDALQRQWRDDPDALQAPGFFEDGWPERFAARDWSPPGWVGSGNAAFEAQTAYDRLRKGLDGPTCDALDRILGAFFWEGGDVKPDLPGFEPGEGIANVLAPETVAELAGLADAIDLEALREPVTRRCRLEGTGWVGTFEEFRDYIQQWLDMLREARDSGLAAVLWVA